MGEERRKRGALMIFALIALCLSSTIAIIENLDLIACYVPVFPLFSLLMIRDRKLGARALLVYSLLVIFTVLMGVPPVAVVAAAFSAINLAFIRIVIGV